ncbi:MAG TPA: TolC family protein [Gemmatimonadaceae bacterium]|nr:TolC family protein [Gemmatimonadaceae bacterium]
MYPKIRGRTLRRQRRVQRVWSRRLGIPFSVVSIGVLVALVTVSHSVNGQTATSIPISNYNSSTTVQVMRRASEPDSGAAALDSLVALARAANPAVRAAESRVVVAHSTIGPAGARPDPMLMAGVLDFPYGQPRYSDDFTMNMLRITQTFPFPGKLSLATRAAEEDEAAARATLAQQRLDVARDVRDAYYELAFVRRARDIVQHNAEVLGSLARITETQYTVGNSAQADVLRARVEVARLGDEAASLDAQERTALARLNAVLDRPSTTPVGVAVIPNEIARLAGVDSGSHVHFSSNALGGAASDSPLLPLDSLVTLAMTHSPMLRAREARISAQEQRLALARKAHLPDFDISLEYDQRPRFNDYVSFFISVPLRLQKRRKQDQEVVGAAAELSALAAERSADVNSIRQEVATRVSDVERERTMLALSLKAVLPQARATFTAATASYQVGRVDFASLVDAQAAVFNYETAYWRSLTDFAKAIAELQRTVGAEVVR